ncbi:MAG: glycosyltransferase family 4 protein [Thermoflexales bacterium]
MRLLFVSNYYPPFHLGGYEELCEEVARGLVGRGHEVHVLTSRLVPGQRLAAPERNVWRLLYPVVRRGFIRANLGFFVGRTQRERDDLGVFEGMRERVCPDVVVFWGMWNLTYLLAARAEEWGNPPVAYYIADIWPGLPDAYVLHWSAPARSGVARLGKRLISRFARLGGAQAHPGTLLKFERAMCVSAAVRDLLAAAGLPVSQATVLHNGIDLAAFPPRPPNEAEGAIKLLYAGRLMQEKGVETAIDAISVLTNPDITLTLLGACAPDYERLLRERVGKAGLQDRVMFAGRIPRAEMPERMAQFDALVVPSIGLEGLPRVAQEAMALGLVVIGTPVGGIPELVVDEVTGLAFPPGDAAALARQIDRLDGDAALRIRLSSSARAKVERDFSLDRMITDVESYLRNACSEVLDR